MKTGYLIESIITFIISIASILVIFYTPEKITMFQTVLITFIYLELLKKRG